VSERQLIEPAERTPSSGSCACAVKVTGTAASNSVPLSGLVIIIIGEALPIKMDTLSYEVCPSSEVAVTVMVWLPVERSSR
jgi:hypothetical protein